MLLAILAFLGCSRSSQPGGGQNRSDEFTIRGPATTVSIPEGGTDVIAVSLSRGSNFQDAVKLQFNAPDGVEVDPKETTHRPVCRRNARYLAYPCSRLPRMAVDDMD